MSIFVFSIGINHYRDPLIPALTSCERDARDVTALLKEGFGYNAEYLEERMAEEIEQRIAELGARLAPGDTFIFYFSGHGKAHADDHYLLLTGARLAAFDSGAVVTSGVLSYRALKHLTSGAEWQGVHRLFIIDACRDHLIGSKKSAGILPVFDGDYLLKDFKTGAKASQSAIEKNLTLLNSCTLGSCALEIPALGHGVFTAALLDNVRKTKNSAHGLAINLGFAQTLALSMDKIARQSGLPESIRHQPMFSGRGLHLFPNNESPITADDETDLKIVKSAVKSYNEPKAITENSNLNKEKQLEESTTPGALNFRLLLKTLGKPGKFIWLAWLVYLISMFLPISNLPNSPTCVFLLFAPILVPYYENEFLALLYLIPSGAMQCSLFEKYHQDPIICIFAFISLMLGILLPFFLGRNTLIEFGFGYYVWCSSYILLAIGLFNHTYRRNPPA